MCCCLCTRQQPPKKVEVDWYYHWGKGCNLYYIRLSLGNWEYYSFASFSEDKAKRFLSAIKRGEGLSFYKEYLEWTPTNQVWEKWFTCNGIPE